jgi:hypothetical protein
MLAKSRGLTVVAVLTLALGIGANTAIFSVVNAVLLRPLPYNDPDRIVTLWQLKPGMRVNVSPANFSDWRTQSRTLEDMSAYYSAGMNLFEGARPQRIRVAFVSSAFLHLLGVRPTLGRDFRHEEETAGKDHVLLLTDEMWRRHFQSDPRVLGKTLFLNGQAYTIIGVLPHGFAFPYLKDTEVWAPLAFPLQDLASRGSKWVRVAARLRPGASLAQARAEMDSISAQLEKLYPDDDSGWRVDIAPLFQNGADKTPSTLLERRTFSDRDVAAPVVIVNRARAPEVLRGEAPIDKRLLIDARRDTTTDYPKQREIVGGGNVQEDSLDPTASRQLHVPHAVVQFK